MVKKPVKTSVDNIVLIICKDKITDLQLKMSEDYTNV